MGLVLRDIFVRGFDTVKIRGIDRNGPMDRWLGLNRDAFA